MAWFPRRRKAGGVLARTAVVVAVASATVFLATNHLSGRGACPSCVAALTLTQRRAIALSRIRRGMLLSQEAKHNVTAAEEACGVWENVLSKISSSSSSSSIVADDVLSLSKSLYASCLVRVGRDAEAVSIYDSCLAGNNNNNDDDDDEERSEATTTEWRLARARCLQRLLRYSDATEEYSRVVAALVPAAGANDLVRSNDDDDDDGGGEHTATATRLREARLGAATCILRSTGDVPRARDILADATEDAASADTDVLLLSSCLDYFETGNGAEAIDRLEDVLSTSDKPASFLLYRWILASLKRNQQRETLGERIESGSFSASKEPKNTTTTTEGTTTIETKDLFMELIRINTSPLDDPGLLRLDDKIELHGLLRSLPTDSSTASSYWPDGFILPVESTILSERPIRPDDEEESELWIAKSRAGYGSHGNRILTLGEARKEIDGAVVDGKARTPTGKASEAGRDTAEPYLLQRMIDPLMLLGGGYKFSLRIYVVSFSSDEAYISSRGLVKLASAPLFDDAGGGTRRDSDNDTGVLRDAARHMTNSGRETVMRQEDLNYLWSELDDEDERERLWGDICGVAADVLGRRYHPSAPEENRAWKHRRESLGIPKILGLDFVVDATHRKPWLVEVNRFPGLEPRDEDDRTIKYRVVGDAWKKASERLAPPSNEGTRGYDENGLSDGTLFESLSCDEGCPTKSSLERLRLDAES